MGFSDEHKRKLAESIRASWTPERKAAYSQKRSGVGNPFFGKKHSLAHRKRIGDGQRGENNQFYGKKHSQELIDKLKKERTGTTLRLQKYGVSPEQYKQELAAGKLWCNGHKQFFPRESFINGLGRLSTTGMCGECNKDCLRVRNLKKYKLTPETYAALLASQGGGCAICGRVATKRMLAVDHCHKTGATRGILCSLCNHAVERIDAIPDWLGKAAIYIAKYS